MTTKERILTEIDTLNEAQLEALYAVIQQFLQAESAQEPDSLLTRLSRIQIDGPEDFAANLDLYLSGDTMHGAPSSRWQHADKMSALLFSGEDSPS